MTKWIRIDDVDTCYKLVEFTFFMFLFNSSIEMDMAWTMECNKRGPKIDANDAKKSYKILM